MFINASLDSRSLDMVDLRYVFNLLSVLNERSHSANVNVIGNVHKTDVGKGVDVRKELSIACCECLNCTGGSRSASSMLHHFLFHRRSSTSTS